MSLTETPGEATAIARLLRVRSDVRPHLQGGWTWTPEAPYPPLKAVESSIFWTDPMYESVRDRLLRAAPQVNLSVGGGFLTLRTAKFKEAEAADTSEPVWFLCDMISVSSCIQM